MPMTVEAGFQTLLSRLNLTDNQQTIATGRISGLQEFFGSNFQMAALPIPVGSYARGTLCSPDRDIDVLAPFQPFGSAGYWKRYQYDSRAFLYWVRDHLNSHYHATTVSSRQVAVKLDFSVIVADVTPCFPRKGGGYLMPNGNGRWMATNPPFHAQFIATADAAHNYRLKPLVRLIKAWNFANDNLLRSFHVELMVEAMKRGHSVGSWPEEVAAVLSTMPGWVQSPFPDPWDAGSRVDAYLSAEARKRVLAMLEQDTSNARQAEYYRQAGNLKAAFERWNMVYRHTFPAYV